MIPNPAIERLCAHTSTVCFGAIVIPRNSQKRTLHQAAPTPILENCEGLQRPKRSPKAKQCEFKVHRYKPALRQQDRYPYCLPR
jgi:hypothetical protein